MILKKILLGILDLLKLFMYLPIEFFNVSSRKDSKEKLLLIIKLDEIGDYILFRNFLKEIKKSQKFNEHKIILFGNIIWRSITEKLDSKYIDDFIWLDKKRFMTSFFYRRKIMQKIKAQKFDTVINASYSRKYFLDDSITKWAFSKNKIGFDTDLSNCFFWQKILSDKYYDTLIKTNQSIFEFLKNKIFYSVVLGKKVSIDKPEIDISGIRSNFELNENYIIFYMGGRRKYKRWSVVNFEKVSKFVELSYNYKIVLIGSDSDKSFSSAFLARHYSIDIVDLTGKTSLLDVMKIAANARVVLSNDSAIAHISAVAGTPTIVLVNGTHFGRFFPYPAEIGLNVYSIYPPEIMSKISEFGFLADKFRYRSNLDINLIEPQTVIEKIAKLLA